MIATCVMGGSPALHSCNFCLYQLAVERVDLNPATSFCRLALVLPAPHLLPVVASSRGEHTTCETRGWRLTTSTTAWYLESGMLPRLQTLKANILPKIEIGLCFRFFPSRNFQIKRARFSVSFLSLTAFCFSTFAAPRLLLSTPRQFSVRSRWVSSSNLSLSLLRQDP